MGNKNKNNKVRQQRQLKKQQRVKHRKTVNLNKNKEIDDNSGEHNVTDYEMSIIRSLMDMNLECRDIVHRVDKRLINVNLEIIETKEEISRLFNIWQSGIKILKDFIREVLDEVEVVTLLFESVRPILEREQKEGVEPSDDNRQSLYQHKMLLYAFFKINKRNVEGYDELYEWLDDILEQHGHYYEE